MYHTRGFGLLVDETGELTKPRKGRPMSPQSRTRSDRRVSSEPVALAPWWPATPIKGGVRRRIQGARVFASFAAILISTRRAAT